MINGGINALVIANGSLIKKNKILCKDCKYMKLECSDLVRICEKSIITAIDPFDGESSTEIILNNGDYRLKNKNLDCKDFEDK